MKCWLLCAVLRACTHSIHWNGISFCTRRFIILIRLVFLLLGLKTFATFLTLDWNDVHSAAYRGLKSFLLVLIRRVSIWLLCGQFSLCFALVWFGLVTDLTDWWRHRRCNVDRTKSVDFTFKTTHSFVDTRSNFDHLSSLPTTEEKRPWLSIPAGRTHCEVNCQSFGAAAITEQRQ